MSSAINIKEFATSYRLKTRADDCDDLIIQGKQGDIYECGDELGVVFMPPKTESDPWGKWCPAKWEKLKKEALAAGMTLRQNGDCEGALSFSPNDKVQAKLAIKIAGVRAKKQISEEQRARLSANLAKYRSQVAA